MSRAFYDFASMQLNVNAFFKPITTTSPTTTDVWHELGNMTTFGYQPQSERNSISGLSALDKGQTYDTITTFDESLITLGFNRINSYTLAIGMNAMQEPLAASSTISVTAQTIYRGGRGGWLIPQQSVDVSSVLILGYTVLLTSGTGFTAGDRLYDANDEHLGVITNVATDTITVLKAFDNPISGATVKNFKTGEATGTTTTTAASVTPLSNIVVVTTDFTLDNNATKNGPALITPVVGAGLDLANLDALTFSYDYDQFGGSEINLEAGVDLLGSLMFVGRNSVNNKSFFAEFDRVVMSANADIVLASEDDRLDLQFEGVAQVPSGSTSAGRLRFEGDDILV